MTHFRLSHCFFFASLLMFAWVGSQGCGIDACQSNQTEVCECPDGVSATRTCKADRSGFGACDCKAQETTFEPVKEPTKESTSDASNDAGPDEPTQRDEPVVADEPVTADEPMTHDEPMTPDEPSAPDASPDEPVTPDDGGSQDIQPEMTPDACGGGNQVMYLGKCVTAQVFCTQRFNAADQQLMNTQYTIIRGNNGLVFCQTKLGGYYLPGNGYGRCDADGDGWITLEAYRAVTHVDARVKDNARCALKEIQAIVYHADVPNAKPQVQLLQKKVPLLETFRNDGQGKVTLQPIYTEGQVPLPKGTGGECLDDKGCTNKLCYNGYCIAGRRFDPSEINTMTKACIAGIDLNDNQLDDASEAPTDTTTPKVEFAPFLKVGFFMELQYGYYEASYDNKGQKIPVFHIKERTRRGTDKQRLQLNCRENPSGKAPGYWRSCPLRGDQRCTDPTTQTTRKGLSRCWMPNVRVGTRSLFKCVTFNTTNENGYFAPAKYGYGKDQNYSRSSCKAVSAISTTQAKDIAFSCSKDDGKQAPKAGQNEVGWACVSFKDYTLTGNYLAGCVQECTESKMGASGIEPCGANSVCTLNKDSYGQGVFGCFSGKNGVCSDGTTLCEWGKYATCQANEQPSTETCNSKDDDCNGKVDDLPTNVKCWTGSQTTRGKGLCKDGVLVCNGGTQSCANETKPVAEICDGSDNDCDDAKDDGCPKEIRLTRTSAYTRLSLVGAANTRPLAGETVSTVFVHCPTGEALRGIQVWSSSSGSVGVTQLTSLCGSLQLQTDRTKTPHQYSIASSAYNVSKTVGAQVQAGTNRGLSSLKCPKDMVVVGIEGDVSFNNPRSVKRFRLHCALLVVKGTSPTTYKVEYGTTVKTGTTGYHNGGTTSQFGPFFCPKGEAAAEIWANQTKDSLLTRYTAFSVTCRPIAIVKQ